MRLYRTATHLGRPPQPTSRQVPMLHVIGTLSLFATTIGLFITTLRFDRRARR